MCAVIFPLSYFLTSSILHTSIIVVSGIVVYGLAILVLRDSLVINLLKGIKLKIKDTGDC